MRKLNLLFQSTQPQSKVSVPLRGLDMRKLPGRITKNWGEKVSVPLRGLDMRKPG